MVEEVVLDVLDALYPGECCDSTLK
jgi:hypothetical protein